MATKIISVPELAELNATPQFVRLFLSAYKPNVVFRGRVNQSFSTLDRLLQVAFDTVTVGAYTDIKPGMTILFGSATGLSDLGIARVRKAPTSTVLYIGESSNLKLADNAYITVTDAFLPWPKHLILEEDGTIYIDGDITYSDQHTNFPPVVNMGPHAIVDLKYGDSGVVEWNAAAEAKGSTISTWSWTFPGSDSSTDTTTATPTATYSTPGNYPVYVTVTAANGKSSTCVRYVFVYDENTRPFEKVELNRLSGDIANGGWSFSVTVDRSESDLVTIEDGTLCVLHMVVYRGDELSKLGPIADRENVLAIGWIEGESITISSEESTVEFSVAGISRWLSRMQAFPFGIQQTVTAPTNWVEMRELTIDKALISLLYYRTTALAIVDFFPTGDTKFAAELATQSSTIFDQVRDLTQLTILVNCGSDRFNAIYTTLEPQLVPEANRNYDVIMEIDDTVWHSDVEVTRSEAELTSLVSLSGVSVTAANVGSAYFSLAPGHVPTRTGDVFVTDNLLLSSQDQANTLASLLFSWKNATLPEIRLPLTNANLFLDIFPTCMLHADSLIAANARGITVNGNFYVRGIEVTFDANNGALIPTVSLEGEVFEGLSADGDVPGTVGSDIVTAPRPPKFPPFPDFPVILPTDIVNNDTSKTMVAYLNGYGPVYTANYDSDNPTWVLWTTGLDAGHVTALQDMYVTPNGTTYAIAVRTVYRATAIGEPFTKIVDDTWFMTNYGQYANPSNYFIAGFGVDYSQPDRVAMVAGGNDFGPFTAYVNFWSAVGGVFTQGAACTNVNGYYGQLTCGATGWTLTNEQYTFFAFWDARSWHFNLAGTLIVNQDGIGTGGFAILNYQIRVRGTDTVYITNVGNTDYLYISTNNGHTLTQIGDGLNSASGPLNYAIAPTGDVMMGCWNTGRRGRSANGGVSWEEMGSLPFGGDYLYCYHGGTGGTSRWTAAGGIIRYSANFGVTWENKEGNILSIATGGLSVGKIIDPLSGA